LRNIVAQEPRHYQIERSRWSLKALMQVCHDWLRVGTEAGMRQILRRFAIHHKRGRLYLHSPDQEYARKRQRVAELLAQVRAQPKRFVLLYLDELSFTRQPTVANDYAPAGHTQPLARLGHRANYEYRVLAALDALSGQVHYQQRNHIRVPTLSNFCYQLRAAYPQAEQIFVVLDNWPVHYHPDGVAVLQPQPFAADFVRPPSWPAQAKAKVRTDNLPICLVPLPTYASWLNPIEKLWRWLKQDVLHLHRFEDDSDALKAAVCAFLDRFAHGSRPLLHYTGLLPN
jgi:transposase